MGAEVRYKGNVFLLSRVLSPTCMYLYTQVHTEAHPFVSLALNGPSGTSVDGDR